MLIQDKKWNKNPLWELGPVHQHGFCCAMQVNAGTWQLMGKSPVPGSSTDSSIPFSLGWEWFKMIQSTMIKVYNMRALATWSCFK